MVKRKVYSNTRQDFVGRLYDNAYEDERWERVPELEHKQYWVSNYGRVLRRHKGRKRLLFLHQGRSGLELRVKGKHYYSKCVHLLVADLFQLTEPKDKVSFRDGNRLNPRLSNLMIKGTRSRHRISPRQKEFCKELFKRYPQEKIVSELALRFMVKYLVIWRVYKEFIDECITNGVTAYAHLATDPGLLRRFPNVYLDSNGTYVRSDGRPLAWTESTDGSGVESEILPRLSKWAY